MAADEVVAKYRLETKKAQKDLDRLAGRVDNIEKRSKKSAAASQQAFNKMSANVGNSFKRMGSQLMTAIGVGSAVFALTAAFKDLININKQFELQMAKVKAITGATSKEFKQLSDNAKLLGGSTKFTASEVAKLQEEFAKLGFSTSEIVGATESTLLLAEATGTDLAQAANVAGQVLRAFGIDANDTQRVVDVMAKSFSSSALNIEIFAESMKFAAPIARAAGIDIETVTAMLGRLADAGLRGSIAGTGLKNLLSKLADENSALSEELGFAVRNSDDLFRALKQLQAGNIDLTKATELTDERSKAAFITLINGADDVQALRDSLVDATGSAREMAEIMRDTLSGDIDKTKAAWESLMLAMEESEGMRQAVQLLSQAISVMTDKIEKSTVQSEEHNARLLAQIPGLKEYEDAISNTERTLAKLEAGEINITQALRDNNEQFRIAADAQAEYGQSVEFSRLKHTRFEESLTVYRDLQEELRKLKDAYTGLGTGITDLDAVTPQFIEAELARLKAINDSRKATDRETVSIGLLQEELKGLKKELSGAEVGSTAFFSIIERLAAKTKELDAANEMMAVHLGEETESMKAARTEAAKYAKELRKLLKAKIDSQHASEDQSQQDALAAIDFRAALQKLETTQTVSEAEGRADALKQIEIDRLTAQIEARKSFRLETDAENEEATQREIELEQELADILAGIREEQDAAFIESAQKEESANSTMLDNMRADRKQYTQDTVDMLNVTLGAWAEITRLAAQLTENQYQAQLKSLENALDDELITREQFDRKKAKIAKEHAKKRKSAAIIQAVINTALGITNALATAPNIILGIVLAAIAAATGAVQIGIISSQPVPSFAEGVIGIDGPGTRTSDSIHARLSRGETVMTADETDEHRKMFEAIRAGRWGQYKTENILIPEINRIMGGGWDGVTSSLMLNSRFSDRNMLKAFDRNRSSERESAMLIVAGIRAALKSNGTDRYA